MVPVSELDESLRFYLNPGPSLYMSQIWHCVPNYQLFHRLLSVHLFLEFSPLPVFSFVFRSTGYE